MREQSWFILTRGLVLCAFLLFGTILLLLRAQEPSAPRVLLQEYAEIYQVAALTSFGSALIGSLVMEDLLRYYDG